MSLCATSLVTNGFITCCVLEGVMTSCRRPNVTTAVEVRPRIRRVAAPVEAELVPQMIGAKPIQPSVTAKAAEAPSPTDAPTPLDATELRPRILDVKEE